jgi:hypothetical protein
LYEISIGFFSSNFVDFQRALTAKYGEPTDTKTSKVRTEEGHVFPLTNVIWDNGVSRIKLTNADGDNFGRAKLRFIHRQLFLSYARRVNDARDSKVRRASEDL